MTTRMTATLVSRVSRRARALPSLNLKKKRDSLRKHPFLLTLRRWGRPQLRRARRNGCFRRRKERPLAVYSGMGPEGVYSLERLPCSVFEQGRGRWGRGAYLRTLFWNQDKLITIHVTRCNCYRVYSSKKVVWVSILSHFSFVYHKILRWKKDYWHWSG